MHPTWPLHSKQGFQKTRKALKTNKPRKLWFEKVQRTKSGSQLDAIFFVKAWWYEERFIEKVYYNLCKSYWRTNSWMLMNIGSQLQKWEKFTISALEVWIRKGVQKGGHHFRMLVPTICTMIRSSGGCFRGQICIFLSSHCVNSNIIGCPPFALPFSSFHFLKNSQPQIFPESKIKFVWPLDRNIKGCEF